MSSSGMIAIVQGGEFRLAQHCQYDSTLRGHGHAILGFLQACDIERFRKICERLVPVTEDGVRELDRKMGLDPDRGSTTEADYDLWMRRFPETHFATGSQILYMLYYQRTRRASVTPRFAGDGLFCEWAFVIDFDRNSYDLYVGGVTWAIKRGYNHGPFTYLRPAKCPDVITAEPPDYRLREAFVPVHFVVGFTFHELPLITQSEFDQIALAKLAELRKKQHRAETRRLREYNKQFDYTVPYRD